MQVDRIVQFSPLVRDMDEALDGVHALLGAFPSRRNRLGPTGVDLAIIPFGDETFLELVAPFEAGSAGARLLQRTGPGWFMINVDLRDDQLVADIDREVRATGARVVAGHVDANGHAGTWHIHPQDAGGVLLALYVREDRPDHTDWAGTTWKHFVETNRRVVDRILGASVAVRDIEAATRTFEAFGFTFTGEFEDDGARVREAMPPGGTFLQLRQAATSDGPLAAWLDARGPGLYHLAWGARDLDRVRSAVAANGGTVTRETTAGMAPAFWAAVPTVFGMPLEFRALA
ncbi:MAG: VOC family protein [Dehalococcoidia bacterium]|nr:VOC family protein [Dehalococcoidia bacterium]